MINVSIIVSGQTPKNLAVADGFSLSSLLAQEGFGEVTKVTFNGVPTEDLTQTLTAGDSVFVTRSNKGGVL